MIYRALTSGKKQGIYYNSAEEIFQIFFILLQFFCDWTCRWKFSVLCAVRRA